MEVKRRNVLALLAASALTGCATPARLRAGQAFAVPGQASEEQGMRAYFESRLPNVLLPGDRLEKTEFAGIWAVRRTPAALPRYFDEKVEWFVNMPQPVGLQGVPATMTREFIEARKKAMAAQLRVERWPLMAYRTRPLAVVYSAWDCPYSRAMEADFRKAGISYYVVPTGLTERSVATAQALYGSARFQSAWQALMAQGASSERSAAGSDAFPSNEAGDIAFLFMLHGRPAPPTPLVIFPDGEVFEGWETKRGMALAEKHLASKVFFA